MNICAVSTLTYDPLGSIVFQIDPGDAYAFRSVERRVTRTATLDGGAVIVDGGYSPADRTLRLKLSSDTSADTMLAIQRIFKTYSMVILFTPEAAFNAAPQSFSVSSNSATANFLVKSLAEVKL